MSFTIDGLPVHPLIVHLAVIAVPVAALATIILALVPRLQGKWALPVLVTSIIGAVAAFIASSSGEALAEMEGMNEHTPPLAEHAEYGEATVICAAILAVLLAVNWILSRKNKVVQIILSILLIGSSIAAVGSIYQAGHEGAKLVWSEDES